MKTKRYSPIVSVLFTCWVLAVAEAPCRAQVSPMEMRNPKLRTAEQAYLQRLMALNKAISDLKFPFSFSLNRYAGLDPKDQVVSDTRGIEFVDFHGRVVLKVTGNYNAAFSGSLLTANQRSDRVFEQVVAPVLKLLPDYFKPADDFDDVGFEICYHVLAKTSHYEYEGREMLTIVFDKGRALSFASLQPRELQQEALNQSDVYLNGKLFGLALGENEPLELEAIRRNRSQIKQSPDETRAAVLSLDEAAARSAWEAKSVDTILRSPAPPVAYAGASNTARDRVTTAAANGNGTDGPVGGAAHSQAEVDTLQAQYQSRLDALATEGAAKHHFVEYSPPSFVLFQHKTYLQITMRDPQIFDADSTSIYKRTARSFDLFLAPELKTLLARIPEDSGIEGLDITVLDQLDSQGAGHPSKTSPASQAKKLTSEALEFVCPLNMLRRFADAEITNQELLNGSIILVNGVRIGLNLQQVE